VLLLFPKFVSERAEVYHELRKRGTSTAKTAFEIMSFNLQVSDEPLVATFVASERRVRAASNPKSLALLIDFSRVFGPIWPLSRMVKPYSIHAFVAAGILPAQLPGIT
jgi:hypothetical protein